MDLQRAAGAVAVAAGAVLLATSGVDLLTMQERGRAAPAVAADASVLEQGTGRSSAAAGVVVPRPGPPNDEPRTRARSQDLAAQPRPADLVLARPERIVIPALDIDADLVPLSLEPDGRLEVPSQPEEAGWWSGGAAPGAPGPAVIAGHVDSVAGPAVFHRLRDLRRGDEVVVVGERGSVSYHVVGVEQHPKAAFPTDRVYGATSGPTLRLVTCGGRFDRRAGHYDDNVVVYATAA